MSAYFDINTLRSLVTGFSFLLFVAVLVWAYRPARKAGFDEAAQLPFLNAEGPGEASRL